VRPFTPTEPLFSLVRGRANPRSRFLVRGRANPRGAIAVALTLGVGGLLPVVGCGGDDVTQLMPPESDDLDLAPDAVDPSRTFAVLAAPDSLDAVCRLIGVSSAGNGSGDPAACAGAVAECRSNVAAALGGGAAPNLGVPEADLEPLLGCPLTLAQLDACIGTVLERGIQEYGSSIDCEMAALPSVDPIRLLASPDCLAVVLQCPALVANFIPVVPPRSTDPR
jgi:hypothetical protein